MSNIDYPMMLYKAGAIALSLFLGHEVYMKTESLLYFIITSVPIGLGFAEGLPSLINLFRGNNSGLERRVQIPAIESCCNPNAEE